MRTMATTKVSETELMHQLLTVLPTSGPLQRLSRLK
jgi:hypothetical protein